MIYQGDTISVSYLEDGLVELKFDAPGSVNKFDLATLTSFDEALDKLYQEPNLKGVVLTSGKSNFFVGADIKEFLGIFELPKEKLAEWLKRANDIFNRLEDLPVPTVSAITGFALGGGCECVLATDFRVADITAQVGLPEVKLGIMPGFGGTVRLPRLLGADNALEWISTGKTYRAEAALKVGFLDAVVLPEKLVEASVKVLKQAIAGDFDWQARRQTKTSGLQLNRIEAAMCFTITSGMVAAKAGRHYPAPMTAVKTIEKAAPESRERALGLEMEGFIPLAKSDVAKSLISIFLNDQTIKTKAKAAAKSVEPVCHAGVLGAGIMGGGIAYQSASKGIPVVMKDINTGALELGMNEANKLLNKQLKRGKIDGFKLGEVLSDITPTLSYDNLSSVDLVVEAVVENPKVKASVLAEVEEKVSDKCVIASNTSTIPISELAKSLKDPSRFCGMHFFNPVHRMPLVEIIRGKETSDETINIVVSYAAAMGKSPIVVNDCPGFFVNRVLFPYFFGFSQLIAEGVDFAQADKVMESKFGWPMGPAYLLDVVGIDTGFHAAQVMAAGFPERMSPQENDCIELFYNEKRFGQKTGEGFYLYTQDKKGRPKKDISPSAYEMLAKNYGDSKDFEDADIINRLMMPMINEVVLCLEEGVIGSPAEADMALVYGLGFPPFRGGVFKYLDTIGLDTYVAQADALAHLGPLYQVSEQLREKAKTGGKYYGGEE